MSIRDSKLNDYIDSHYEAIDEELRNLRNYNEENTVPLILKETEGILRQILRLHKPERILEIGTAYGYSSVFFAKCLPKAHITTIERNPVMIEAAKKTYESFKESDRITMLEGDALIILEDMVREYESADESERFDFIFIDGAKSHYKDLLNLGEKMCTRNAIFACDNILLRDWIVDAEGPDAYRHRTSIKYMKQFLDYIHEREDLDVSLLSGGDGLAVIRFKNDEG